MGKEIKSFAISQLSIASTCNFHVTVNEEIQKQTPAELHIEDKAARYKELCSKLQLIVNRATAFVVTTSLKDQDRIRDNYVGVLHTVSLGHMTNPIEEKREAASRLKAVLAPYVGVGRHEYSQETAEIKGLLAVLAQEENAAAVAKLDLTKEVEGLKEANIRFKQLFEAKAMEASARKDQKDIESEELCREANEMYLEIVKVVNAYAIVKTSEKLEQFIDKINGYVTVYSSIIDRSSSDEETEKEEEATK